MKPRELIPLSVLLLFMMLVAGSILYAKPRIERELSTSVLGRIEALHYYDLCVSLTGRDVFISGKVESASRKSELRDAIEWLYGIRTADLTRVAVDSNEESATGTPPPSAGSRSEGMIFLAVHVLGFLVVALLLGMLLGWSLFSAKSSRPKSTTPPLEPIGGGAAAAELEQLQAELVSIREENEQLRAAAAEANQVATQWAEAAQLAGEERDAAQTAAADTSIPDDLTRLKGVGPVLAEQLKERGVVEFRQIAEWGEAEIDYVSEELKGLKRTLSRYDLVQQAQDLVAGS